MGTRVRRAKETAFPQLHIPSHLFEGHCRVIAENCHPISIAQWRAAVARQQPLPDRPVLVTFDDGYRSGYELARKIRKSGVASATRLIALSGYGQDSDIQAAHEAGFDDHLTKPPDFEKLDQLLLRGRRPA